MISLVDWWPRGGDWVRRTATVPNYNHAEWTSGSGRPRRNYNRYFDPGLGQRRPGDSAQEYKNPDNIIWIWSVFIGNIC